MSISDLYDREARAATNHALFREVNERVKEVNEGFSLLTPDERVDLRVRQRHLRQTDRALRRRVWGHAQGRNALCRRAE